MVQAITSNAAAGSSWGQPTYILQKTPSLYYGYSTDSSLANVTSASFYTCLQTILNNLNGHGRVFIKKPTPDAVFDIAANILQFTFPDTGYGDMLSIVGEGQGPITITGTGTKMLECLNTDWGATVKPRRLELQNLYLRHNCSNATDITLDLLNCYPRGNDVICRQTNATRQGTAFHFGGTNGGGGGAYGQGNTLIDASALYYGTGFYFDQAANGGPDHFTLIHPYCYGIHDYGFRLQHTWFTQLIGPEVALEAADVATCYPFYFHALNFGISLFSPILESGNVLTKPVFTHDTPNVRPSIFGFSANPSVATVLCDVIGSYRWYGSDIYKTESCGTDTIANGQTTKTTAHGLCTDAASAVPKIFIQNNSTIEALQVNTITTSSFNVVRTGTSGALNYTFKAVLSEQP